MTKIIIKKKIYIITIAIIILMILLCRKEFQQLIQNIIYPKEFAFEVEQYANLYGIDKNLVYAVIKAESNFDKNAISNSGAKGLMQLMPDTAYEVASMTGITTDENTLFDPTNNINLGTKYLSILINKYGNIEVAVAAYNAGSGNVDSWISSGIINADGSNIENIPFKETNNYVRKILRDYRIYKNKKQ